MKLIKVLNHINQFEAGVFHTSDIAVYFNITTENASKILGRLAKENHLVHLKRGLWAVNGKLDPLELPNYLLSPSPAYISFQSALYYHNVIDQIPSVIYAAALHKTIKFITPIAVISFHQIHPSFFFGYTYNGKIKMATAEKALIDTLYLSSARSNLFTALPELDLDEIDIKKAEKIITKIHSKQRQTLVLNSFKRLTANSRSGII